MNKTLLVLALLGATGIAQAASVTLYGRVDAGFKYNYVKSTGYDTVKVFTMENGLVGGSRVGVKGVEAIGDLKVGFQLENGFNVANGDMNEAGKLFDRQARVFVEGDFGSVNVGRFGGLSSDAAMDVVFGNYALGSEAVGHGFAGEHTDVYNLALQYQSPRFAGAQVTAMYANSNKADAKRKGYLDQNNAHYFGLAVDYNANALGLVASYEQTKEDAKVAKKEFINLAGSYDFDVVKAFAGYQFVDAKGAGDKNTATLGLTAPFCKGELAAQVSHGVVKFDDKALAKLKKSELAVRYAYDLSQRTQLFVGAGAGQEKQGDDKTNSRNVYFGLGHNF